jgi:hypothetical protein
MPVPKNASDARKWVREAIEDVRYMPSIHFRQRCRERGVTMNDVDAVIARPRRVEPYATMPKNGGTCWRFFGLDVDGDEEIAIGIEAFEDADGHKRVILCTVLPPKEKP